MDFSDEIKKIKPKISVASLKTYNSLLKNVHRTVFGDDKPSIENFKKEKTIMEYLNKKPYNTRKTFLAALLCVEPDIKTYKDQMNEDIRTYRDEVSKSELTDKLDDSAISQEAIDGIMSQLKQNAKALLKKQTHTITDLMEIQNWVILSMYYVRLTALCPSSNRMQKPFSKSKPTLSPTLWRYRTGSFSRCIMATLSQEGRRIMC